jgi:methylated-DNA-[protein]-cysteine S-methyltransferase
VNDKEAPMNITSKLASTTLDSPVGTLTLVASADGLRAVLWEDEDPDREILDGLGELGDESADAHATAVLDEAARQLGEYFAGERREFDLPLDPHGTDFQLAAWRVLRTIPYGETITYGEQARRMGDVRKSRAVGAANGRNPISIIVPCHRVIGSDGSLTGFAAGIEAKAWLLHHEQGISDLGL